MHRKKLVSIASVLASGVLLSGCAPEPEPVVPDYLVSATEAGFTKGEGLEITVGDDVELFMATPCGPDGQGETWYPWSGVDNSVSYLDDGREYTFAYLFIGDLGFYPESFRDRMNGEFCTSGTDGDSATWSMEELNGFSEDVFAFTSVASGKGENGDELQRSTARAYGKVDGYMVYVVLDNDGTVPPSEEELKVLWDLQVAKVKAMELYD